MIPFVIDNRIAGTWHWNSKYRSLMRSLLYGPKSCCSDAIYLIKMHVWFVFFAFLNQQNIHICICDTIKNQIDINQNPNLEQVSKNYFLFVLAISFEWIRTRLQLKLICPKRMEIFFLIDIQFSINASRSMVKATTFFLLKHKKFNWTLNNDSNLLTGAIFRSIIVTMLIIVETLFVFHFLQINSLYVLTIYLAHQWGIIFCLFILRILFSYIVCGQKV